MESRRNWHAFHNAWATCITSDLNGRLPEGFFAEPNVQFNIKIDVAAYDDAGLSPDAIPGVVWTPPAPTATIPLAIVTDMVEVTIFATDGGPVLAGVIQLVSPANKDRRADRDAFTSKCAAYLQAGVGLIVVDVVTNRGGNLHAELLTRLFGFDLPPVNAIVRGNIHAELMTRLFAPGAGSGSGDLYAAACRPVNREGHVELDIWREPLALGGPLPVLALWLKGGPCLPVDLGATYDRTRRELRLADGA